MAAVLRKLRRRILTPNDKAVLMSERGFHVKNPQSGDLLETIGRHFLKGYAFAAEAKTVEEAEANLEQLPTRFRGFAYEGAGMGYAMRDGLPIGGSRHFARFLAGRARHHEYMAWIGLGWAMARLPRMRWSRFQVADPLMCWLVLDGYGFHQAYFKTQRYVREHHREPAFPWPGGPHAAYANRAIDQGIGRALWFIGGTDPDTTADLIEGFQPDRRADLWSGAGLAATYAGGADEDELRRFMVRAEGYHEHVAQGSAFAATARQEAGLIVPHTAVGLDVLCGGITAEEAERVCRRTRPAGENPDGSEPAFETWRRRISAALVGAEAG
ncbi:DUF1702 family protein [Catenulispora subtropica]|uniref:DUF1702 family protein n=1 Tax=Catenulispora subtropica TaxID=450798 RepID=A0ABN2T684_9ACTN